MSEHRLTGPGIGREIPAAVAGAEQYGLRRLKLSIEVGAAVRGSILVFLIVGALGFWHLDRYPRTWFDEGSYLEVSGNIANSGQYFSEAPDGSRDFAPVIAAGPTVLLPAAATQAVFGSSLWAGRLVGVVYLVLASTAVYLFSRRLFGGLAALGTVAVLFAMPAIDWLGTGRQLLGEVPALLFLVVGLSLAFRARSAAAAVLAGLVLGLATITKGQYLLVLPPVIVLVAIFDFFTGKIRPIRWYAALIAAMLAAFAGWFVVLLSLIGEGSILENYRLLRDASSGALLVFSFERMRAAWTLLIGPQSLFLVVPSVAFSVYLVHKETNPARRLVLASLSIFQVTWFGWFAMASIAWPRYAFPAFAISSIFAGGMIVEWARMLRDRMRSGSLPPPWQRWVGVAALAAISLLLSAGMYRQISPVFTADEREPQNFAAAMDAVVPVGSVVDGWEPEVNFLSERDMQYPPNGSLDRVVRATWLGAADDVDLSATLSSNYLVVGHFSQWVGVYDAALASGDYRLILSQDGFDLYERSNGR